MQVMTNNEGYDLDNAIDLLESLNNAKNGVVTFSNPLADEIIGRPLQVEMHCTRLAMLLWNECFGTSDSDLINYEDETAFEQLKHWREENNISALKNEINANLKKYEALKSETNKSFLWNTLSDFLGDSVTRRYLKCRGNDRA